VVVSVGVTPADREGMGVSRGGVDVSYDGWEPTGKWFHFSFFEDKHDHMVHVHPHSI